MKRFLLALLCLPAVTLAGQSVHNDNIKLTPAEFSSLASRCAPSAAVETMLAIAQTESALYVDSLSLNRPIQAARNVGFDHRRLDLLRQPRTRTEAIRWMQWFSARGYTVSIGLMQVNIENARLFQLTPIQLFDPCTNISVGAALLADNYRNGIEHHQEPQQALLDAISMYNSGSATMGYTNGYVDTVLRNAPPSAECNQFCRPVQHYAATQCKVMLPPNAMICCHFVWKVSSTQKACRAGELGYDNQVEQDHMMAR